MFSTIVERMQIDNTTRKRGLALKIHNSSLLERLITGNRESQPSRSSTVTPWDRSKSCGIFITVDISFIRRMTSTVCASIASMNHFRSSSLRAREREREGSERIRNSRNLASAPDLSLGLNLIPRALARPHFFVCAHVLSEDERRRRSKG
jgi:hypothetical protein